jgi:hypothetical protein
MNIQIPVPANGEQAWTGGLQLHPESSKPSCVQLGLLHGLPCRGQVQGHVLLNGQPSFSVRERAATTVLGCPI